MKNTFSRFTAAFCAVVILGFSPSLLQADDVTKTVEEGLEAYNDNDFVMATQAFETVVQLIKQKKGELIAALLPTPEKAPIKDWEADEAEMQAAGAAFFGGGISAERVYRNGNKEVTVKYLSDSPMIQSIMMMLGNPMFANADGGKLIRLNGTRAIFKYDPNTLIGSIQFAIMNLVVVEINGEQVTADDLKSFGEAVPVQEIQAIL